MLTLRDPIHGFIRADRLEAALIDSRPIQRLRHVHQLGLTSLVFPGAEHSRFSHALGAMELAGRVYDALAAKGGGLLPPRRTARERRLVRLAALFHDAGHAPFSHSAEELFEEGLDHEAMGGRVLGTAGVREVFARHADETAPAPEEVAELLAAGGGAAGAGAEDGTADEASAVAPASASPPADRAPVQRLLAQIVSGELDVDKMDYLLRDSLYCGVRYGNFDLDRLVDTLVPLADPETGAWGIGVEAGGVHAVEALVMARYYMFTQVYFNPVGKALELHLNEWLEETGRRWPADPGAFLEIDDVTVWAALRASDSAHARAVVGRRHYPLAFETAEHLSADERAAFARLLAELRERFGHDLLVSHSAKDPHRMGASRVLVRHGDGRLEPMARASHFMRHLGRIDRYRVYAPPARRDEVARAIRERWAG